MNAKYEQQMKKGVLEMLVLNLLRENRKYGYQLISELREQSHEMLKLKEGTLYPILYRMEEDGLVKAVWSEAKGKEPSRKYYEIQEDGKKTLSDMKALWGDFSCMVNMLLDKPLS